MSTCSPSCQALLPRAKAHLQDVCHERPIPPSQGTMMRRPAALIPENQDTRTRRLSSRLLVCFGDALAGCSRLR
eukprot:4963903-Amphidinium_carterae.1